MKKPNVIYILADDMGYGDVSALNERCGFHTPSLDELCKEGMSFLDAHSTSAVCTPSRYSILTGEYCWRSMLKRDVLQGYDKPIIENGTSTIAGFLKCQGYRTACIGKWHLGMEWPLSDPHDKYSVDFTKTIADGPIAKGFDYFYGISASLDMPPYVYIENDHVTALPDRIESNEWDRGNSYNKQMFRKGPVGRDFHHEEVLDRILQKAMDWLEQWKDEPFFLYFPLTAPHGPILPTAEFEGRSGTTEYGDFVLMCDAIVGKINHWLKQHHLEEDTILIFTSDNGGAPRANYSELAQYGHNPSYIYRGGKFDIFEGGHRIPLIVKWKNQILPGTVSKKMTSLVDLYATLADILGVPLEAGEAKDSVSAYPLWKGEEDYERKYMIFHSVNGSFSIRNDKWKLIMCPDSGGKSNPVPGDVPSHFPDRQLYSMEQDVRERKNVIADHPEIEQELMKVLIECVAGDSEINNVTD